MIDYCFDIECLSNLFTIRFTRVTDGAKWKFIITPWLNQGRELNMFLHQVRNSDGRLVGFNNLGYDYPMVHMIMELNGIIDNATLYSKSTQIINAEFNDWSHQIWDRDRFIPQIDLMRVHHFDNQAKRTSLKLLEFNMRMDSIEELELDFNKPVRPTQVDTVLDYNDHDVDATVLFYKYSEKEVAFREQLSEKYGRDFMNHNDTRIGQDFFVMELAKRGINASKHNQTHRMSIKVDDIILPYVQFERPEFNEILRFFRDSVINPEQMKGFFKDVHCVVDGFRFDFGAGGIHGSVNREIIVPPTGWILKDSDVSSYYPNLAIANRFYPLHLTEAFCDVYLDVYNQRKQYAKKTAENNMLKLALNGVYGKSNDKHSPFYDPQYTMSITINGQLLLCMLAEQLMKIPGLKMVQINTDGLTYLYPEQYDAHVTELHKWWESLTKLELEHVNYTMAAVRDVNSYLAVTDSGKVKRIGAYAYVRASEDAGTRELPWHKDHGAVVVAKAAEAALVRGENIEVFIRKHLTVEPLDFMLRTKINRSDTLMLETPVMWGDTLVTTRQVEQQRVTRYYVSKDGGRLVKLMDPTADQVKKWRLGNHWRHKKTGAHKMATKCPSGMWEKCEPPTPEPPIRRTGVEAGHLVTVCNQLAGLDMSNVDISYYVDRARKLVDPLLMETEDSDDE